MVCSCGVMIYDVKICMDWLCKIGVKFINKFIVLDEKVEIFELDYDGKCDRWNGYDVFIYSWVIDIYEVWDEVRCKY